MLWGIFKDNAGTSKTARRDLPSVQARRQHSAKKAIQEAKDLRSPNAEIRMAAARQRDARVFGL